MFSNPVRMRYATDCGIAALATAACVHWALATAACVHWGRADNGCFPLARATKRNQKYWGVTQERMRKAVWVLTGEHVRASGASLLSAKGARGVVLCRVEREGAWADGKHWLAWEKDSDGVVWCFNPSDGEVFRAASMTGRGFYALCHFTVA